MTILINEVAWGGTDASSSDEWIELHNPGPDPISLAGWKLTDRDEHINKTLQGIIPPYGFFLMERSNDATIADIPADLIYTGNLNNDGDSLWLLDPSGSVVDSANGDGGPWPAGTNHASMERRGGDDRSGNWGTFPDYGGNGHDAHGNPIHGTPHEPNAIDRPTPTSAAPTPTPTLTCTPTATSTSQLPPTPIPVLTVRINEVAWAGTVASSSDEWIELHNPGPATIELAGWTLTDDDDVVIGLQGTLEPFGFYLLERSDNGTVADIAADQIYSGNLNNAGEALRLLDPSGALIDSANSDGGRWPGGNDSSRASMERRGGDDRSGNWSTFTGYHGNGHDADGNAIRGSPRAPNSVDYPTPMPTSIPSGIVINEVLVRPHYDWEGTGGVNTGDEFVELFNTGLLPVNLQGWSLDDISGGGSSPFTLPAKIIPPGGFAVFFHSRTHIALNDSGDSVRLLDPSDHVIDAIGYLRIRAANLSYGRFPDGSHHLRYGLWPTAGQPNEVFLEPAAVTFGRPGTDCRGGHLHPLLPRLARSAPLIRWLRASAPVICH